MHIKIEHQGVSLKQTQDLILNILNRTVKQIHLLTKQNQVHKHNFACEMCEKTFAHKIELKKHTNLVHLKNQTVLRNQRKIMLSKNWKKKKKKNLKLKKKS